MYFDNVVIRSKTGPRTLYRCTSDDTVPGPNPCSRHVSATGNENDPAPCPTSKIMPLFIASQAASTTLLLLSRMPWGRPVNECVTISPGRSFSMNCSNWFTEPPTWIITGLFNSSPASSARSRETRSFVPTMLSVSRTLMPTIRSA